MALHKTFFLTKGLHSDNFIESWHMDDSSFCKLFYYRMPNTIIIVAKPLMPEAHIDTDISKCCNTSFHIQYRLWLTKLSQNSNTDIIHKHINNLILRKAVKILS